MRCGRHVARGEWSGRHPASDRWRREAERGPKRRTTRARTEEVVVVEMRVV